MRLWYTAPNDLHKKHVRHCVLLWLFQRPWASFASTCCGWTDTPARLCSLFWQPKYWHSSSSSTTFRAKSRKLWKWRQRIFRWKNTHVRMWLQYISRWCSINLLHPSVHWTPCSLVCCSRSGTRWRCWSWVCASAASSCSSTGSSWRSGCRSRSTTSRSSTTTSNTSSSGTRYAHVFVVTWHQSSMQMHV